MREKITKRLNRLEEKPIFRSLQVLYVAAYVLATLFVFMIAYQSRPYTAVDSYKSRIICDNGKSYSPGSNEIFLNPEGQVYSSDDPQIRKLCKYGRTDAAFTPVDEEYRIEIVESVVGSWSKVFGIIIIGLGLTYFAFEVLKRSFFYIVAGRGFFEGYKGN